MEEERDKLAFEPQNGSPSIAMTMERPLQIQTEPIGTVRHMRNRTLWSAPTSVTANPTQVPPLQSSSVRPGLSPRPRGVQSEVSQPRVESQPKADRSQTDQSKADQSQVNQPRFNRLQPNQPEADQSQTDQSKAGQAERSKPKLNPLKSAKLKLAKKSSKSPKTRKPLKPFQVNLIWAGAISGGVIVVAVIIISILTILSHSH